MSPRDMVNIYARSISAMTDLVTASTRMVTNMMFAGIEASRATTNYAKYSTEGTCKGNFSYCKDLWAEHKGDGWQNARGQLWRCSSNNNNDRQNHWDDDVAPEDGENGGCPCAMNIYHNFFLRTTRL